MNKKQNLILQNSILLKGRNPQLYKKKKSPNLLQMLTFKNNKILQQKLQNQAKNDIQQKWQEKIKYAGQTQKFINKNTNNSAQIIKNKNILTQFQSKFPQNKIFNQFLSSNIKIHTAYHPIQPKKIQIQNEQNLVGFQENYNNNSSNQQASNYLSLRFQGLKITQAQKQNFRINAKHYQDLQSGKQSIIDKNKQISFMIDLAIAMHFQQQSSLQYLIKQIDQIFKTIPNQTIVQTTQITNLRTFQYLLILLNKQILKHQKEKTSNKSTVQTNRILQDYYLSYTDTQIKLNSYARIRAHQFLKDTHTLENLNQQEHLFWVKCLMLFLSIQKVQSLNRFRKLLGWNNQNILLNFTQQFIKSNLSQLEAFKQLSTQNLYTKNVFYRIIVKVICDKKLQQAEESLLNPAQRQLITQIKVKYIPNYTHTIQFKHQQQAVIDELLQPVNLTDFKKCQTLIQNCVNTLTFDCLFFKFISDDQNSPPRFSIPIQLLIWKILHQNKFLLKSSNIKSRQWIQHAYKLVQTVSNSQELQLDQIIAILFQILSLIRKTISSQQTESLLQFQQNFIQIISSNKKIIEFIFNPKFDHIHWIAQNIYGIYNSQNYQKSCQILGFIKKMASKSVKIHQNYTELIKSFIQRYVDVEKIIREIQQLESNSLLHRNSLKFQQTVIRTLQSRIIQNQSLNNLNSFERQSVQMFMQKSQVFFQGLLLINNYIFNNFITPKALSLNNDQFDHKKRLTILRQILRSTSQFLHNLKNNIQKPQYQQKKRTLIEKFTQKCQESLKLSKFFMNLIEITNNSQLQYANFMSFNNEEMFASNGRRSVAKTQIQNIYSIMKKFDIIGSSRKIIVLFIQDILQQFQIQTPQYAKLYSRRYQQSRDKVKTFLTLCLEDLNENDLPQDEVEFQYLKVKSQNLIK